MASDYTTDIDTDRDTEEYVLPPAGTIVELLPEEDDHGECSTSTIGVVLDDPTHAIAGMFLTKYGVMFDVYVLALNGEPGDAYRILGCWLHNLRCRPDASLSVTAELLS